MNGEPCEKHFSDKWVACMATQRDKSFLIEKMKKDREHYVCKKCRWVIITRDRK